eukprot:scaffold5190_cov113-Isochrysis_galbana.AAC.9
MAVGLTRERHRSPPNQLPPPDRVCTPLALPRWSAGCRRRRKTRRRIRPSCPRSRSYRKHLTPAHPRGWSS